MKRRGFFAFLAAAGVLGLATVRRVPGGQTFTSSGTWNKPPGKTTALVEMRGAGGGGSGGGGFITIIW